MLPTGSMRNPNLTALLLITNPVSESDFDSAHLLDPFQLRGPAVTASRPNKIGASTPYNFRGKKPTPYGGLLPVVGRALI